MGVRLTLLSFFFLCLQAADGCYMEGALSQYRAVGENFSFSCIDHVAEPWKIFCKDDCKGENLLIKTRDSVAQRGRFRTDYEDGLPLNVAISQLTKSDSGRYRCGTGSSLSSLLEFEPRVADAVLDETSGPQRAHLSAEAGSSITVACSLAPSDGTKSFCREDCEVSALVQTRFGTAGSGRYSIEYDKKSSFEAVLLVTITSLTQSDSGRYRCYQNTPGISFIDFNITVTQAVQPSTTSPEAVQPSTASLRPAQLQRGTASLHLSLSYSVPLIVGVTLVLSAFLLSAALVVSCRRRCLTGLKSRGGLNGSITEIIIYENNCPPEDPTYQSLNPAGLDQNQVYSELTPIK